MSIASAVRWVTRYKTTGQISPSPSGGDRRSGRIEAQRDYLLGLIGRTPDITLLEIQERLMQNCGERFSVSVLWRFFDHHGVTFKNVWPAPFGKEALSRLAADPVCFNVSGLGGSFSRPRWRYARFRSS